MSADIKVGGNIIYVKKKLYEVNKIITNINYLLLLTLYLFIDNVNIKKL